MTHMASTLDIAPGMYVQRAGTTGLLKVSDVREPSHPLMYGLVVAGHYWREDERRYSERETAINIIEVLREQWHVWTEDMLPALPDERFETPDDDMVAWRYGSEITIRQFKRWDSDAWPSAKSNIGVLARSYHPDAHPAGYSTSRTNARDVREYVFQIKRTVTIPDPDDPGETMPIFDGPADVMAEFLIPGTYTDVDGQVWTVTPQDDACAESHCMPKGNDHSRCHS